MPLAVGHHLVFLQVLILSQFHSTGSGRSPRSLTGRSPLPGPWTSRHSPSLPPPWRPVPGLDSKENKGCIFPASPGVAQPFQPFPWDGALQPRPPVHPPLPRPSLHRGRVGPRVRARPPPPRSLPRLPRRPPRGRAHPRLAGGQPGQAPRHARLPLFPVPARHRHPLGDQGRGVPRHQGGPRAACHRPAGDEKSPLREMAKLSALKMRFDGTIPR